VIKYRFDKQTIKDLLKSEWWNLEKDKLHEIEKNFFKVTNFINNHIKK
jgi:hypothetical protein